MMNKDVELRQRFKSILGTQNFRHRDEVMELLSANVGQLDDGQGRSIGAQSLIEVYETRKKMKEDGVTGNREEPIYADVCELLANLEAQPAASCQIYSIQHGATIYAIFIALEKQSALGCIKGLDRRVTEPDWLKSQINRGK